MSYFKIVRARVGIALIGSALTASLGHSAQITPIGLGDKLCETRVPASFIPVTEKGHCGLSVEVGGLAVKIEGQQPCLVADPSAPSASVFDKDEYRLIVGGEGRVTVTGRRGQLQQFYVARDEAAYIRVGAKDGRAACRVQPKTAVEQAGGANTLLMIGRWDFPMQKAARR